MKRTVFVLSILAVLMFSVAQLAEARWKANPVTNETDANVYVIYSTWRAAKEDVPNGFRTRGYYRLTPGETRKFYAWSDNSIYFCVLRSGEAIKPESSTPTFDFWVHPSRAFMIVSEALNASVARSDLTHVNLARGQFVRSYGFMRYSNGSTVNITSTWVPVVAGPLPDDEDGGDLDVPLVAAAPPPGMVLIPAGTFQMGSAAGDDDERPVHTVSLDAFYMDTHEVTNAEYAVFLNAEGNYGWFDIVDDDAPSSLFSFTADERREPDYVDLHADPDGRIELVAGVYRPMSGYANHPVVEVSWRGAMAYAIWAGKRLPTEAEWEYAARGGLAGKEYPWGDAIDPSRANYNDHFGGTTAVGSYPANGYGLHDMMGNVSEWCLDLYDEEFYAGSPARNPLSGAPDIKSLLDTYRSADSPRVLRGGSWISFQNVGVFERDNDWRSGTFRTVGFRCVRSVSP